MNFSMKDIALITTMSGAIIFMSFLFPALGLADSGNETAASEIPEFNLSSSEFDIVGDFPEQPGTPTSGTLVWDGTLDEDPNGIEGISLDTLDPRESSTDDSLVVEVQNSSLGFRVGVTYFNGSQQQAFSDNYPITGEGQTILHENNSWNIRFDVENIENELQPNMTAEVSYEVLDSPTDASGWGLFWPIGETVGMLAYIGDIIFWAVGFIFEISITIVTILIEVMVFAVSLMQWLLGSYFSIVTSAGSWASVVLMLPGIMLFLEFAKLAMLGIKLLPTT